MPAQDLKTIVQQMIDAGEPEENIAAVIKQFPTSLVPKGDNYKGPDTYWGGVGKSLINGDVLKTGLRGGLGWLKGATLDIPSSIVGGLEMVGNLITNPVDTISSIPSGFKSGLSGVMNSIRQSGSHPEEFGRMVGQVTGQPLVTYGLAKGAPLLKAPIGGGLEKTGRIMHKYQPISGIMPRIAEARTLRNIERALGNKIEGLGERMQIPSPVPSHPTPTITSSSQPTVNVGPSRPPIVEPTPTHIPEPIVPTVPPRELTGIEQILAERGNAPRKPGGFNPSFGGQPTGNLFDDLPKPVTKPLSVSPVPEAGDIPLEIGDTTSHLNLPRPKLPDLPVKPPIGKMTYLIDAKKVTPEFVEQAKSGGYKFTGIDDKGRWKFQKGEASKVAEPRKQLPSRSIQMGRGVNDQVKVVFANDVDKDVFRALAIRDGQLKNINIMPTIEKQFPGVDPGIVRKAAMQFRQYVIDEGKRMPKYFDENTPNVLEPQLTLKDFIDDLVKKE